jgi:putative transposase
VFDPWLSGKLERKMQFISYVRHQDLYERVVPLAEIETKLHPYLATVFQGCDSPALIINGGCDHIHALFTLARTWAVADVVEEVKKRSSKWLKTKDAKLQPFQWQAGYGAFSVSQAQVGQVRRYITNQKAHHGKQSFQDEYCALLQKYGIEFDEGYLWD